MGRPGRPRRTSRTEHRPLTIRPHPAAPTPPPAFLAFSTAWAAAWQERLNASDAYREAAALWEGDLVLELTEDDGAISGAVYLDLWRGHCRAAREASPEDRGGARYLLRGERRAWQRVLAGRSSPIAALLTGQLRLVRGSLSDLMPYAGAAQQLLATAATFETIFPDS